MVDGLHVPEHALYAKRGGIQYGEPRAKKLTADQYGADDLGSVGQHAQLDPIRGLSEGDAVPDGYNKFWRCRHCDTLYRKTDRPNRFCSVCGTDNDQPEPRVDPDELPSTSNAIDGADIMPWIKRELAKAFAEAQREADGGVHPPTHQADDEKWIRALIKDELYENGLIPDDNGFFKLAEHKHEPQVQWADNQPFRTYCAICKETLPNEELPDSGVERAQAPTDSED